MPSEGQLMVPTSLYLPTPASANGDEQERLVLPQDEPVDVYLSRIPQVRSKAQELCDEAKQDTTEAAFLQKARSGRCLNVLQGEVAHASALQTDVLVSAEATTCHVVALRSTRKSKSATVPLVSLAHVDQAGVYDNCLDAMVQQHLNHHSSDQTRPTQAAAVNPINSDDSEEDEDFFFYNEDEDTGPQEEHGEKHAAQQQSFLPPSTPNNLPRRRSTSMPSLRDDDEEPIEMELHMVGGYLDKEGTSQDISHSLITSFSELAKKYQDQVRISLTTALISSLNTTNATNEASSSVANKPKSRGLGIDTQTGQVFPITDSLPPELEGPGLEVRTARSLARATSSPNLHLTRIAARHSRQHARRRPHSGPTLRLPGRPGPRRAAPCIGRRSAAGVVHVARLRIGALLFQPATRRELFEYIVGGKRL